MPTELPNRKSLTFEQAEGAAPLPQQLKLKELSHGLRASLWHVINQSLEKNRRSGYDSSWVEGRWASILQDMHALRYHLPSDEFDDGFYDHQQDIKALILSRSYIEVFGWLQWVLRHPDCPKELIVAIARTLERERAAYRVIDSDTICPIGSEAELATIKRAFFDLGTTEFHGARTHLSNAAAELSQGHFADSVRESIHAVESVARTLEPTGELGKALAKLEASVKLHGGMKAGFSALYGYTSDSGGIRHALLSGDVAPQVDEADALFMIGACAAFVSYLINKARAAGLVNPA